MADTVEDGKVVSLHYTLTLESGQKVDSSREGDPLLYLHGASNIVPGLEESLSGRKVGESLDVKVPPEKGYGERDPAGEKVVQRGAFPDDIELEPGMQFGVQDEEGNVMPIWVLGVAGDQVKIDMNHPLSGETLNFAVEVVAVREASAEETEHGHPHGPGGHDH